MNALLPDGFRSHEDDLRAREVVGFFEWKPGRQLLRSIRSYQRGGWLRRKVATIRHRFWSVITGCDIPINCQLGKGLLLTHPNGIVIHPHAVVGERCLIFHQVTLGTVESRKGAPVIGNGVDIGAGAKILGPVRIGDGARIGVNAVVLTDVPAGATAVGIPARITKKA